MKNKTGWNSAVAVLNFLCAAALWADPVAPGLPTDADAQDQPAVITEIGPDSRTWEIDTVSNVASQTKSFTARSATLSAQTPLATAKKAIKSKAKRRVVELGTGMNYWDGNQWSPSDPSFEATNGWFVAEKVQHQVRISENLNVSGAVRMVTDGMQLQSTPLAIGLFDPVSGEVAIIARLTNCAGVLLASNEIVYQNAFDGVSADVVYSLEHGSFSQDVVLADRIDPARWGFSTNCQIQIITEFYQAPEPDRVRRPIYVEQDAAKRARMVSPDFVDTTLGFGQLVLGRGKAYALTATNTMSGGAVVAKDFVSVGGRTFLVESVEYGSIGDQLAGLPAGGSNDGASNLTPKTSAKRAYAAIKAPQKALTANPAAHEKAKRFAALTPNRRAGLVIDYFATLSGTTNSFVFARNTTYHIVAPVTCSGPVTFEGGAVLKYNQNTSLTLNSTAACNGGAYNPIILTSVDDDTVGESCRGTSGYTTNASSSLRYANPAIQLNYPAAPALSNMRFLYCQSAINIVGLENTSNFPLTLANAQLVNCIQGITVTSAGGGSGTGCGAGIAANNALFGNVGNVLTFAYVSQKWSYFTHCTIDKANVMVGWCGFGAQLNFTNSVFANVTNLYNTGDTVNFSGINNGFYNCQSIGSGAISNSTYPFVAQVGAGSYYLAGGSPFRDAGSSAIDPNVLRSISTRTTFAPIILTNTVTQDTVLLPQVRRDTDTPDLGFHYDPIDYIANVFAVSNCTLTISNGTTIAGYWGPGIWLQDGASIVCQGTATAPNRFVDYLTVQEEPITLGNTASTFIYPYRSSGVGSPGTFRFTEFRHLRGGPWTSGMYSLYAYGTSWLFSSLNVSDCAFLGGGTECMWANSGSYYFKNNLFEQDKVQIVGTNSPITFYNNLIKGGEADFLGNSSSVIQNNAFDTATVSNWSGTITHDHNAYINTSAAGFPTNGTDLVLTNFTYGAGPLGSYYQVSTSLMDKGSCNATNLGFYHYTTRSNLVKETNSIVDIGLHYVATDSYGNPIDSNGDGIPDYSADVNGNGVVDNGEIPWTGTSTFKVWITRPAASSILP